MCFFFAADCVRFKDQQEVFLLYLKGRHRIACVGTGEGVVNVFFSQPSGGLHCSDDIKPTRHCMRDPTQ